jgi:hypothetical protein
MAPGRRDKIVQDLMGSNAPPGHHEEPKAFSAGRADRLSKA